MLAGSGVAVTGGGTAHEMPGLLLPVMHSVDLLAAALM